MPPAVATSTSDKHRSAASNFDTPKQPTLQLPYQLDIRPYQQAVWDYMMQDKPGLRAVTIWPRRNGKDLIDLNILIAKACTRVGLYLYIGPLHTQTRQIVWLGGTNEGRKFLDYFPPQIVVAKRNSVMEIDLFNGSMIKVVGSDQYDSLMGLNAMGAIFTEYSLQRPEAWQYIRPMMAANGGWAKFNGTPRGMNHFYHMYRMAQKNPEWFCQYYTRDDTGVPTEKAIEEERNAGMKESLIQQEFYCSWEASSEDVFIPLDVIAPTIKPEADISGDLSLFNHEPRILGCDVAYAAKGDKATICYRQGRKVHFLRWYQGMDNMAFADEIARFIKLVKPHIVNIDAGRGEGVISRLEQLGYQDIVRGVHFGGKVYEEGIYNMKALMWSRTLEWFMSPNIPDMTNLDEAPHGNNLVEEELVKELSTPFMQLDEKNQIRVEPKSSLKSRGEDSPDLAEGLTLTFAELIYSDEVIDPKLEELGITPEMLESIGSLNNDESYNVLGYMDKLLSGEE